jgi:hypothetical protein
MSFTEDFGDIAKRLNTLEGRPGAKPEPAKQALAVGSVCFRCQSDQLRQLSYSNSGLTLYCLSCGYEERRP